MKPICDELEPHGLYSCPRWLEVLDQSGRSADHLVTSGLGLLPLHRASPTSNRRYATSRLLRGLPEVPDTAWAFAGAMSAYQTEIPIRCGVAQDAASQMLRQALALVEPNGLLVPYLTDRCRATLDPELTHQRFLEDLDCWIETPAADFDAWMAGLRSKPRRNVRADLRRFTSAGLSAAILPLRDHLQVFSKLVSHNALKYGSAGASVIEHLDAIASVFDTDAVLYCAIDRNHGIVGAMLGIFHRDELFMRMSGFDYDVAGGSAAYFVVAYYEPLRQRPRHGFRRVHHGTGALTTKRLHGAAVYPLWTLALGFALDPRDVARANGIRAGELGGVQVA